MGDSIQDALLRVKQGDPRSWFPIVDHFQELLLARATVITKNAAAAEEAVQDAWSKAFRSPQPLPLHQDEAKHWLLRITVNCAIDKYKSERRHRHVSIDASAPADEEGGSTPLAIPDQRSTPHTTALEHSDSVDAVIKNTRPNSPLRKALLFFRSGIADTTKQACRLARASRSHFYDFAKSQRDLIHKKKRKRG